MLRLISVLLEGRFAGVIARGTIRAMASPTSGTSSNSRVEGSGAAWTDATGSPPRASDANTVTRVEPSRFTSIVNALPFGSLVNSGLEPEASNIAKPKVLPEDEVPSGTVRAGPLNASENAIVPVDLERVGAGRG